VTLLLLAAHGGRRRVGPARVRILGEASIDRLRQTRRHPAPHRQHGWRRVCEVLREQRDGIVALERRASGERKKRRDAE